MPRRLVGVVALVAAAACPSTRPGAGAAPAGADRVVTDHAAIATGAAADDARCRAACGDRYPSPPDPDGYASYCAQLCTVPTEPAPTCVSDCARAGGPGAFYDDDGEYHQPDDPRTDDERAAADDACARECATVPTIEPVALTACVDACVGDGGGEVACATSCDPDPYDACRYAPCD